jgi:hypothetical protein
MPEPSSHHSCPACGSRPNEHPQTHLIAAGQEACVDGALAPLLTYLWMAGVTTEHSCQDCYNGTYFGMAQLVFGAGAHLEAALTAITAVLDAAGDAPMLQRLGGIAEEYELLDGVTIEEAYVDGKCVDELIEVHVQAPESLWTMTAKPHFNWRIRDRRSLAGRSPVAYSLYIPTADLPALTAHCQAMAPAM